MNLPVLYPILDTALLDSHGCTALDAAVASWRKTRRLGGDARARNRILHALYKGG